MPNIEETARALRKRGYEVSCFETGEEAAQYLDGKIDGYTVGFGDSETLLALDMYNRLSKPNKVHDPMHRQAVEHGSGLAARNIGLLYENGENVLKNLEKAFYWYQKAVSLGYDDALEDIEELKNSTGINDNSCIFNKDVDDVIWSIYDRIHKAIQSNGELPPEFTVEVNSEPDKFVFIDGAVDGVCYYHNQLPKPDLMQMVKAVKLASNNHFGKAEEVLLKAFSDEETSMLAFIDDIQKWIHENSETLNGMNLYNFARHLLLNSFNKEAVKFGLSVIEIMDVDDDISNRAIHELATSDEFTLFALFAVRNRANANNEIFQIAKKVHGWGRIHAVDFLKPTNKTMVTS